MTALKVFVFMTLFALVYSAPSPGFFGKHEHVKIHVPYKVHTVHHHHVEKVPVEVIKEVEVVKHVPIYKEVHVPIFKEVPVHHVHREEVHVPVHVHHDDHHHHDIHHDLHHDIHHDVHGHDFHKGWTW